MAGRPPKAPDETTFLGRIGAEIRKRREKKRLTVPEAADAAGAPVPTWYQWESGRHLKLTRLPDIAAALGCKVRMLIPDE